MQHASPAHVGEVHRRAVRLLLLRHSMIRVAVGASRATGPFVVLSTEYGRKQFETLTEQAKQLTELAQKVTLATAEPLKAGVAKAFNQAA